MSQDLPTKLGKEPLIDAVFEVRFEANGPVASLMPGLVLPLLSDGGATAFESLPASQLPPEIRDSDEKLKFAPHMRILWGSRFAVLFGDRTLAVGCRMPYAGWTAFKVAIVQVMSALKNAPFISKINNCSLKYVDFFDKDELALTGLGRFNVALTLGSVQVRDEILNIRCEVPQQGFLHVVTILTSAILNTPGQAQRSGAILDVDTHRINETDFPADFVEKLPNLLESMHNSNKQFFFSCLSPEGIRELEPRYE